MEQRYPGAVVFHIRLVVRHPRADGLVEVGVLPAELVPDELSERLLVQAGRRAARLVVGSHELLARPGQVVAPFQGGGGQLHLRGADEGLVPIENRHYPAVPGRRVAGVVVAVQGVTHGILGVESGQPAVQVGVVQLGGVLGRIAVQAGLLEGGHRARAGAKVGQGSVKPGQQTGTGFALGRDVGVRPGALDIRPAGDRAAAHDDDRRPFDSRQRGDSLGEAGGGVPGDRVAPLRLGGGAPRRADADDVPVEAVGGGFLSAVQPLTLSRDAPGQGHGFADLTGEGGLDVDHPASLRASVRRQMRQGRGNLPRERGAT
ncbi:hypothetical protein SAMN05216275_106183 [Streptosporangium canum]|uniref:Uncharacterized protein n=1 Tax=Streptosporangium canum TaxID=324952 RepID=A0A1I3NDW5_9ACTN|nr:hypothetical protein SAMN05216275_106183 [Streptosporangium canum]